MDDHSNRAAFLKAAGLSLIGVPALAGMVRPVALHMHGVAPDSKLLIPQKAATISDLSTFSSLLSTTPTLYSTLEGPGPFTVFAPGDEAFAKLTAAQQKRLMNPTTAQNVLSYHVINGSYPYRDLMTGKYMTLLTGQSFHIIREGPETFVNHALIQRPNVGAVNGYIHIINKVLMRGFRTT